MQTLVANLAAMWPELKKSENQVTPQPNVTAAQPLVTVRPRTVVKPGSSTTLSMTLSNSNSQSVHLEPIVTDLLGSQGGKIPASLLSFNFPEVRLASGGSEDLSISLTVPADAVPGVYSGLLVIKGVVSLLALIKIDIVESPPGMSIPPLSLIHI